MTGLRRLLPEASCLTPTRPLIPFLRPLLSCGGEEAAFLGAASGAGLGSPFPGSGAAGQGAPLRSCRPRPGFVRCLVSRMYVLLAFFFFFNGKQD